VSGQRLEDDATVKLVDELVEFCVTVPVGLTHGAAQVTAKIAPLLIAAMGSLNVTLMRVVSVGISVA
jgi:hypothetical protein